MELATGRVVKESSTGPGGRGSEAGRYGSSRSEGEKSGGGGARDYARDGGGGRSSDRDRDRDRRGGGGDKHQYRRKDSSESRGGGGSTRHYSDSRHDKAYRYTSHRDRSSSSRRDGKDKDRQRSRDSDRGSARGRGRDSGSGGDHGSGRSSSGSRGDFSSHRGANGSGSAIGGGSGGSAGGGGGGGGRRLADLPEEAAVDGNGKSSGGFPSGERSGRADRNGAIDAGGEAGSAVKGTEGVADGAGAKPSSSSADGAAVKSSAVGGDGEEGEVLLSGSSSPRGAPRRRDASPSANGGGGSSVSSGSVDGGGGGGASATRSSPSSPPRGETYSPGGGAGVEAVSKPAGKDRWGASDREGGGGGGGEGKAGGGGNGAASLEANGAADGGSGGGHYDGKNGLGGAAGNRGESGGESEAGPGGVSAEGEAGRARRRSEAAWAEELKLAMAAGKKAGGTADGPAGEGEDGSGGGNEAGIDGGEQGGAAPENGGGASRRNSRAPMTVFTRHQAAQDTYNPLLYGCRSVDNYERIEFIDEGAYGKVYCALNKATGEVVALKQVKLTRNNGKEGFPITALRETNVLLSLHNPNIVRVLEMVVGSTLDKVYMVMEYFDHDLKSVMRHMRHQKRCFSLGQVKSLVLQLLSATEFMHRHWYIHRDLKTSNLLYNHQGKLAICDFGLARKYEDPIRPYTTPVVTQWYRCPELLLGEKTYSTGVDTWSVGTIFGELVLGSPMFQGKTEIDQLKLIFGVLGSPTEDRWPGWTKLPGAKSVGWRQGTGNQLRATFPTNGFSGKPSVSTQGLELMNGLLALDPQQRMSAHDALKHCWFTTERPAPTPLGDMPQVDSKLDKDINNALAKWSKAQIGKQSMRGGISPLAPSRHQRPEIRPKGV
ncbi:unnamed protein product [Ectocarpus sp. 12 AP-2014]